MVASTYLTPAATAALQAQIDQINAQMGMIPTPSAALPTGVADSAVVGTDSTKYSIEGHVHPSKARKQIVTMSSAASTYTWTYPTVFKAGVIPICSAIVQVPAGNTDLFNVQILGVPTNTSCTFQINRVSSGLLALATGALSVNPTPVAATLHMIAFEP